MSKDATIREIHHRVKNNLQTVAALLRLQGRRLDDGAAREALEEAQRRVASIALVHETLAHARAAEAGFDDVADRVVEMVAGSRDGSAQVQVRREGRFGPLPPEVATALSLVLVELLQNAVEHGLRDRPGTVAVTVRRDDDALQLSVQDDGVGVPPGFGDPDDEATRGLGLQIVRTLVESELGGALTITAVDPGPGTEALVRLVLPAEPSNAGAPAIGRGS